jgi:hypothetical protein
MSRYLMRLATRGREAASMQPSVRTSSPVAEHDQRIGMAGFEGFEVGEASTGEWESEAGAEQGDILESPMPPTITTAGETGVTTAQRKIASSPAGTTGSTARGEAAAADAQTQARVQSWSRGAGAPDLADAHDVSLSPSGPSIRSPASSTGTIHSEALSIGDLQTGSASRRFGPGDMHTRSIRQTRQVDSTHLEPSPGALAEHFKPPSERAGEPSTDAHEGPRIVIGRINVEVVPPPAAPPSTAASRPGPLTAASASVIGPLSGGIRPSLRLSLRHR